MKIILLLALLGCSLAYTEEDDVLVLTKDTFQQALDEFKFILVEFYAPWCGHCKKLAPEYSAAAKELKKAGDGYVPLAKVDATVESSVAEKYDVQGYPTLKFFVNGSPIDFEGGRNAAEIIAWITKKTGPASQELNASDLQAFIDKSSSSPVVVFFGTDADDKDFVTFKQVALSNEKLLFGHTFDQQAKEQHNPKGKIVLFKGFDEKRNDLEEALTEESFKTFLNANSVPTLLPFNDKAIGVIFQQRNNALFLFTDDTETGQAAYEAFASVAAPYKDRLKFSFSKQSDGFGLFGRLAEYIGASQTDIPNIMLFDQATNGKFKFQGDINADSIRQFVENFFEGKLTRFMKSEEIPATNDDPVKIVVGKNYQDLVLNNDKDVLIEFYAPWCGHCKQLAPIYEELAKELSVNPNIIIAKCDATGNEIEGVNVESFPTLKFWKNGQKDTPIAYNGGRDKQAFLDWLKENTSHPWVDLDRANYYIPYMTEAQLREQKIINHVWSQDGKYVAVSFRLSNNIAIYEVDQYQEVNKFRQVHQFKDFSLPAQGLAWSSQNMLLAGGLDKAIFIYRGNQDGSWTKDLVLCNNSQAVLCGAWSPNGNKFAIGTSCKKVYIGHYENKNVWWDSTALPSMNSSVVSVKFHPSGRVVGFCGSDNTFRLVSSVIQLRDKKFTELEDQEYNGIFKDVDLWNHEFLDIMLNGWINDFSFNPSGDKIVITSHTSQLQLITIKEGESVQNPEIQKADTYNHKGQPFLKLVFINKDIFVAAGYERKLYVFTTENNQIKQLSVIDKPLASQLQQKALSTTNALKQQLEGQKNKLELQPWEHQLTISSLNHIKDDLVSTSDLNGKLNVWKIAI